MHAFFQSYERFSKGFFWLYDEVTPHAVGSPHSPVVHVWFAPQRESREGVVADL